MAGGARLRDVPMLASGGLAVTPLSPNGSESPEEIEEFDWFEEENEQGYAPDSQENRSARPHVRAAAGPRRPGRVPGAVRGFP